MNSNGNFSPVGLTACVFRFLKVQPRCDPIDLLIKVSDDFRTFLLLHQFTFLELTDVGDANFLAEISVHMIFNAVHLLLDLLDLLVALLHATLNVTDVWLWK